MPRYSYMVAYGIPIEFVNFLVFSFFYYCYLKRNLRIYTTIDFYFRSGLEKKCEEKKTGD